MTKNKYWLHDATGVYAQVEGADQRDYWTRVQGWSEASEPGPTDQVHVQHDEAGRGRLPFGAIGGGWDGLGWSVAAPPEPVDMTKDPVLVDQPPALAEPVKPASAPASSGTSKEK